MPTYNIPFKKTIEDSFLQYAGHVIQRRSIPSAEDCLKYSARQLLYSQYREKLIHNKPHKKAQRSVAAATGFCYVHGDSSAYGTFIRMAKPFALRYPLEEVQGHFGTQMDKNDHAAARYVEMWMSPLANQMFESIQKDTIDLWKETYDQEGVFPMVLPTLGFYNIVNGSAGIAVGMGTSIPQFNLEEVNNALIKLLWNENATFEDLYCPIDFATGGTIINEDQVKESLKQGHGKAAKIRATIEYEPNNHQLIVTEMPYSVYTNTVCAQIESLVEQDPNCGIIGLLDGTGVNPKIIISLSKKAVPNQIKEWLYKNTSLQNHFSINMTMLKDGSTPKVFGWVEALQTNLNHQKKILKKDFLFDLQKYTSRLHIVEGLIKAISIIDKVVALIKAADSVAIAKVGLVDSFSFSTEQAEAILKLQLQRLVNLEITKLEKEQAELINMINYINNVLNNQELFYKELEKILKEVSQKFKDKRRTTNTTLIFEDEEDVPLEDKQLVVTISRNGSITAMDTSQFALQNKGGKGKKIVLDNDLIQYTFTCDINDTIMLLSNLGKSYSLKISELGSNEPISYYVLFDMENDEYISSALPLSKIKENQTVVMITKKGLIKRTSIKEYQGKRKSGLIGIKIKEEGDQVVSLLISNEEKDEVILSASNGQCIRFKLDEVRITGRITSGVKAMTLGNGAEITSADLINQNEAYKGLVSITKTGQGKLTHLSEIPMGTRASKGVILQKLKGSDELIAIKVVKDEADIVIVTKSNVLKIPFSTLKFSNRATMGTTTINKKTDQQVLYITQVR